MFASKYSVNNSDEQAQNLYRKKAVYELNTRNTSAIEVVRNLKDPKCGITRQFKNI